MKRIACAAITLMVLFSGQSYAEQFNHPAPQDSRDAMILPAPQQTSPYDFNHMDVGSDKSDALGVPYYNQHG